MSQYQQLPPVPRGTLLSEAWRYFYSCLAKENYARLQGRAGRMEYWSATIIGSILTVLPLVLFLIPSIITYCVGLTAFLAVVFYLAMPMLSVYVRRLHDVGWSGWWIALSYAIYCIPFGYAVFTISSLLALDLDLIYMLEDIPQILREEFSQIWLFLVLRVAEILSIFLFVITLMPGTKGLNKYDH